MLRDYIYDLDASHIGKVFKRFDHTMPEDESGVALIEFRVLTPDSFIWRFLIGNAVYYLYAEDFIEGLESVEKSILEGIGKEVNLEFIKVKEPKEFNDSEPHIGATTYTQPNDSANMMLYAADSGHDFVFLCKSDEKASDAYFNS